MRSSIFAVALVLVPSALFAAPEVAATCSSASAPDRCETKRKEVLEYLKEAEKGNYIAQREVAFCLATGCRGAVKIDLAQACSWLNFVATNRLADSTDRANIRNYCSRLTDDQKAAALKDAEALSQRIKTLATLADETNKSH